MVITDEKIAGSKESINLIEEDEFTLNGRKIVIILTDAAHDNKNNFASLMKKGIKSHKSEKECIYLFRRSPYKGRCVRELKKTGYKAWEEKYCHEMRWISEGYFSTAKRIWREYESHQCRRHDPGSENEVLLQHDNNAVPCEMTD